MGTDYIAPARMPFELKRAGFRVAMLAPRNALAARTAYVDQIGYFPDNATLFEWVLTLAGAVRSVNPTMILPADDVTLRTLMQLVLEPPEGLRPDIQTELAAIVQRSLGDSAGWFNSIDKAKLFELALQNGIAVADGGVAADEETAVGIAARVGYPVIVRLMLGTAGKAAQFCSSAAEIRNAVRNLPGQDAWSPPGGPRVVVQKQVAGAIVNRASLAWNGREVAGFTRGRLATHPAPLGPASVVEFLGLPEVARVTDAVFQLVGMHGLVGTQFVIEPETQKPLLIEINRRMIPATHAGFRVGYRSGGSAFCDGGGATVGRTEGFAARARLAHGAVPAGMASRRRKSMAANVADGRALARRRFARSHGPSAVRRGEHARCRGAESVTQRGRAAAFRLAATARSKARRARSGAASPRRPAGAALLPTFPVFAIRRRLR